MKTCFKCLCEKPLDSFHKHAGMKDGRLNKCADCVVKDVAEWRKKNPEARKKEHAANRKRKGFGTREEYFAKLKQKAIGRKASSLKYYHKRRRFVEGQDTTELDEFVLEEAAILAKLRKEATGIQWHLDHIVPMFHKTACGLNNAFNLQVVPAAWNISKGNRNMKTYFKIAGY